MIKTKYTSLTKGIMMIAAGLLIAFFPGIISRIFYIIGAAVICFSIVRLFMGTSSGLGRSLITGNILGIIIGAGIILLPNICTTGIPMIAGIIMGISGIERIFTAIEIYRVRGKWQMKAAIGILLIIAAGVFIFHPFSVSRWFRIIIGLVIIAIGSFNVFTDLNNPAPEPKIIDVDSYTVSDDRKFLS